MKNLIIFLAKILYWFEKLFRIESDLPGKIALKIDESILKKIRLPDNTIIVTGSNGKTSTVEMVKNVLLNAGFSVACNLKHFNQLESIATMIIKHSTLSGVINKDVLMIESEEKELKNILKNIKPKYLVITNLYRDQLTKNGHPELIYDSINEGITQDIHLVLNADAPLSSLYGYKRENVTYFGMNKNSLSKTENNGRYDDGKYCPNCKNLMKYDYYHFSHIGSYHCDKCKHSRKSPNYVITDLDLKLGQIVINKKHCIKMNFPNFDMAYNLVTAFAVARIFGIDENKIVSTLTNYTAENDKVHYFELNGHKGMILISTYENSISYYQSLRYVVSRERDCTVILMVDTINETYFINDTSWLWDIDFELLNAECVKKIILAGKYANDLAVRLKNSKLGMNKVMIKDSIEELKKEMSEDAIGDIFVITSATDKAKLLDRRYDKWR